jgi:hypothetical protein
VSTPWNDPFTGTWRFDPARSSLTTPAPQTWTQVIRVTEEEIRVREEITRVDGAETVVWVHADCEHRIHPVHGSPIVDFIEYQRPHPTTILGTGWKNGAVVLTETVTIDPPTRTLKQEYSIYAGEKVVAAAIAVFFRIP